MKEHAFFVHPLRVAQNAIMYPASSVYLPFFCLIKSVRNAQITVSLVLIKIIVPNASRGIPKNIITTKEFASHVI